MNKYPPSVLELSELYDHLHDEYGDAMPLRSEFVEARLKEWYEEQKQNEKQHESSVNPPTEETD